MQWISPAHARMHLENKCGAERPSRCLSFPVGAAAVSAGSVTVFAAATPSANLDRSDESRAELIERGPRANDTRADSRLHYINLISGLAIATTTLSTSSRGPNKFFVTLRTILFLFFF